MTEEEEDLMANQTIYPKTEKDIAMENRVNYWKDKLTEILVSPFNHNTWSKL
jgi:phage terminase large subunit